MVELEYIDFRKIWFPPNALKYYSAGFDLPNKSNMVKVTNEEKKQLLKRKNGKSFCFKEKNKKVFIAENKEEQK